MKTSGTLPETLLQVRRAQAEDRSRRSWSGFDRALVLSENAPVMRPEKRTTLPCGLRWDPTSANICFSYRDARDRLHQQSTGTTDPADAMAFKLKFLRDKEEELEKRRLQSEVVSRKVWGYQG